MYEYIGLKQRNLSKNLDFTVQLCSDLSLMREASQRRLCNWHASQGSTRPFPVRLDSESRANGAGGFPSPPARLHTRGGGPRSALPARVGTGGR